MLNLTKVAVTGGLSCGKSLVCRYLGELGAKTVSADKIVHQLLSTDSPIRQQVIELLGPEILTDNKIDREKIAKRVFAHPKRLNSLENIIHPAVYEEIEKEYEKTQKDGLSNLFIAEVPLLYESEGEKQFDLVIVVTSNQEEAWKRYRKSTGYEREEFNRRMAEQLSPFKKAEKASIVIKNDGTPEELQEKVKKLYPTLISRGLT